MMVYIVFKWTWVGNGQRTWEQVMEGNTYAVCEYWVNQQEEGNYIICKVSKEINKRKKK